MAHERGTGRGQRSIVQSQWSHDLDLVDDTRELARDLHGRFDRINRHDYDTKQGGCGTCCHGLESNVNVLGGLERIQGSQNTRIGGRVSKATERTLKQSWEDTSVETGNTTIGVECAERSGKAGSVTVLVIDLFSIMLYSIAFFMRLTTVWKKRMKPEKKVRNQNPQGVKF
jgi:hypothetical protein